VAVLISGLGIQPGKQGNAGCDHDESANPPTSWTQRPTPVSTENNPRLYALQPRHALENQQDEQLHPLSKRVRLYSSQQFASWLSKSSSRALLRAVSFIFSPLMSFNLSAQKME